MGCYRMVAELFPGKGNGALCQW